MRYSFNLDPEDVIFASRSDINASFKDLGAVCDAIRYKRVENALEILDNVISKNAPIEYRKHNKYMGSRHELGGKKGRTPKRCADIVRRVLVNAMANTRSKGLDANDMVVIHAAANKTNILQRSPPKGVRVVMTGGYGYGTARRSNLELARVEIGISPSSKKDLSDSMKRTIKALARIAEKSKKAKPKAAAKQQPAIKPTKSEKPAETKPVAQQVAADKKSA